MYKMHVKGPVDIIISDLSFKDFHPLFTTVLYKPSPKQKYEKKEIQQDLGFRIEPRSYLLRSYSDTDL